LRNKDRQKILVLSGSLGDGHRQAALAILEAARAGRPDVDTIVVDLLEWTHPRLHSVGKFLFEQWVKKLPASYSYLFQKTRGDNTLSKLAKSMQSYNLNRMLELLHEVKPTVVVSTFPPAAAAMSALKTSGLTDIPSVTVVTDHTDHSFWIHPLTDKYLVASERVREALLRKGVADSRIEVTGIPIGLSYGQSLDRDGLRDRHGLHRALPTVLVMGGGLGMIDGEFIDMLKSPALANDVQFILVCGRNRKLEQELKDEFRHSGSRVLVTGFVDHVHELMALSDLIVTKPGGLTTSEALASQLPMLLYQSQLGQEKDNAAYLTGIGAALEAGSTSELSDLLSDLLKDRSLLDIMKRKAAKHKPMMPSTRVLQAILDTRTRRLPYWEETVLPMYAEA